MKSITVGGAVTGLGIESSSFKFGLVHETITEMEILLSSGETVTCTPNNKYKDLFFGFPNSYGTLGYALRLKVKLVPVKKYVEITHHKFSSAKEYFSEIEKLCADKKSIDFIDGTIFSETEMYITTGIFVDEAPLISDYTYMNIYYKSIRKKKKDYLRIKDYIWRWDTDWFWCSKHFGVQNKIVRLFFGRKYLNSITYWKIRAWNGKYKLAEKMGKLLGSKTESVVQDVEIPVEDAEKFITFFHKNIGIKPVWVCPTKIYDPKKKYSLYPMDPSKLYVNFGFWDIIKTDKKDGFYNRLVEHKVAELEGKKSLYSTSFYPKDEFDKLYQRKKYDSLKKKYDPEHYFLDLYDKCVKRR